MKFFRLRRKPESSEEAKELVLGTDAEAQAPAQDRPEAEVQAEASADTHTPDAEEEAASAQEAPAPKGDLLARIGAEAASETEAEGGPPQENDSLDPDLLDIFRDAKNEVQESTLASELENVPIQDLLSDLVGVSHRLRTTPRARAEPSEDGK